jgi:hypothetical protein
MPEDRLEQIKAQILAALTHSEADEGLYFRNFTLLHEEDERPGVAGEDSEIFEALHELIGEGRVVMNEEGSEVVFLAVN